MPVLRNKTEIFSNWLAQCWGQVQEAESPPYNAARNKGDNHRPKSVCLQQNSVRYESKAGANLGMWTLPFTLN